MDGDVCDDSSACIRAASARSWALVVHAVDGGLLQVLLGGSASDIFVMVAGVVCGL